MPTCTIDGREIEVPQGTTVMQAAQKLGEALYKAQQEEAAAAGDAGMGDMGPDAGGDVRCLPGRREVDHLGVRIVTARVEQHLRVDGDGRSVVRHWSPPS